MARRTGKEPSTAQLIVAGIGILLVSRAQVRRAYRRSKQR